MTVHIGLYKGIPVFTSRKNKDSHETSLKNNFLPTGMIKAQEIERSREGRIHLKGVALFHRSVFVTDNLFDPEQPKRETIDFAAYGREYLIPYKSFINAYNM